MNTSIKKPLILSLVLMINSCGGLGGGGGGGSSANYAGDIGLTLEKDYLDSGDLNRVTVEVANLNRDGVLLKIRTSKSLRYVENSAVLFPDREEKSRVSPAEESSSDQDRYLVFFLDRQDAFGDDYIALQLDVKATEGDKDAFIEIDIDNNDPNIPDSKEFKSSAPRFSALERREIYIAPDASEQADQTPTPAVTASPSPNS